MVLRNLLTEKQEQVLKSYVNDNWTYLILSGAVRSGKTYIDNYLFLLELKRIAKLAKERKDPHPQYILAGYSSNTIFTNVINSLASQFWIDLPVDRHGHYSLFGVDIVPAYTGSARGMNAIRGMTSYGAYINECSLATHDVFQEIIDRCSVPGSRVICDTNPDNPEHYLKVDYIDNPDPSIKSFHFTIDDNPTLSKDYVKNLKRITPSGMYYDRRIKGLWVNGEGVVYKDFDKRKMEIEPSKAPGFTRYVAGVDWGYQHYGSIVVFGVTDDGKWYLVDERTKQYKEIRYWTNTAHQLQGKYGKDMPFFADTARPEHIDHFKHHGINVKYGWKSVVPGIEIVSSLMKQGRFFIEKGKTERFLKEIYNYVWDDKASDAVVKKNDDCMDACRYAIASYIHLKERKTYHPDSNNREGILRGMRELGL
ncbi:PBSX family phage terminase large subunit [Limosilactobacillus frumenti]|uniref:PBSX family phage terminase large subunit n=1 Tax=Limosilactobacillus frumenti TaxID=104955 RepID=UPI00070E9A75|nr:PBSX family phage terminase large subunit [Limosilactobacillus frumenti]QFG72777.1 PBSX family phage terminase large subunit [Limosilactobacillus frumenti]